jgi:ABC-2 type transport system permease protein
MLFGTALRFPGWLVDVSPFSHLAAVPAESMSWTAFVAVLAVAVVLSGTGVAAFGRRDVR